MSVWTMQACWKWDCSTGVGNSVNGAWITTSWDSGFFTERHRLPVKHSTHEFTKKKLENVAITVVLELHWNSLTLACPLTLDRTRSHSLAFACACQNLCTHSFSLVHLLAHFLELTYTRLPAHWLALTQTRSLSPGLARPVLQNHQFSLTSFMLFLK